MPVYNYVNNVHEEEEEKLGDNGEVLINGEDEGYISYAYGRIKALLGALVNTAVWIKQLFIA